MDASWGLDTLECPAEVVLLQPVALVDHLCTVDEATAHKLADGQLGGSRRCTAEQLQQLLQQVGEFTCRAGGSASNVARGLASGFGVAAAVVSCYNSSMLTVQALLLLKSTCSRSAAGLQPLNMCTGM
jgi:hypothetical protein